MDTLLQIRTTTSFWTHCSPTTSFGLLRIHPAAREPIPQRDRVVASSRKESASPSMARAASLVWFKRNLRVSDNQALLEAARQCSIVVPFSTIDPASFETSWGAPLLTADLPALGPYRAQFLLESLSCLKDKLIGLGSGLHFSLRPAAAAVCNLVSLLPDSCSQVELFCHLDYGGGAEEELAAVEHAFLEATKKAGVKGVIHRHWDRTLVHPDDLPAAWSEGQSAPELMDVNFVASKLQRAPGVMTDFRKTVEEYSRVRKAEQPPTSLPPLPADIAESSAAIPATAQELYDSAEADRAVAALESLTGAQAGSVCQQKSMFPFRGGEAAAHQRLQHLISGCANSSSPANHTDGSAGVPLACFKDRRMLATGLDNSAKLSAFLNYGCITARQVHAALEATMDSNQAALEGRKWLRMHLQIRDFFNYMHIRALSTGWTAGEGRSPQEVGGEEDFRRWCQGQTGFPFVDASMRELAATGFMSNRSRQNVASFLTKSLGIDWRWGEAVFRCLLVDYDPAANLGNWQYVSGADHDPRGGARVFRTVSQGMKYDERATLIRRWLPELWALPDDEAHKPWLHEEGQLAYFEPLLEPASQLRKEDQ